MLHVACCASAIPDQRSARTGPAHQAATQSDLHRVPLSNAVTAVRAGREVKAKEIGDCTDRGGLCSSNVPEAPVVSVHGHAIGAVGQSAAASDRRQRPAAGTARMRGTGPAGGHADHRLVVLFLVLNDHVRREQLVGRSVLDQVRSCCVTSVGSSRSVSPSVRFLACSRSRTTRSCICHLSQCGERADLTHALGQQVAGTAT